MVVGVTKCRVVLQFIFVYEGSGFVQGSGFVPRWNISVISCVKSFFQISVKSDKCVLPRPFLTGRFPKMKMYGFQFVFLFNDPHGS
jgi:hypothetical protein